MPRRLRIEADGGSRGNPGPAGYGAVVRDVDTGDVVAEVKQSIGEATNNVAEYRGLIAGLTAAADVADVESVEVRMDSLLVVQQMAGRWKVKHPGLQPLHSEAKELVARFPRVRFTHIARELNGHADRLANEAMDAAGASVSSGAGGEAPREAAAPRKQNRLPGWMAAPSPPTTTWLLRHGQTELSVDRRFSGTSDPPLTELGRAQAAGAAEALRAVHADAPFVAVYTSPLGRARETAQAVGDVLGLPVEVEPRLVETDFGDWEGFTFREVQQRWADELSAWLGDPAVSPPNGESFVETFLRVRDARTDICAAHPDARVLLVSHVSPIKTLLMDAVGAGPEALYRLHIDLASLSQVEWYADTAVLRCANVTAHLVDEQVGASGANPLSEQLSLGSAEEPTSPVSTP